MIITATVDNDQVRVAPSTRIICATGCVVRITRLTWDSQVPLIPTASAPDGNRQMLLSGLTTPMAELHGAIDAIALTADPSTEPTGVPVTQLAAQLHTTAASVRADLCVQR